MKDVTSIAKSISWTSLLLIVLPPVLYFTGNIESELMNALLLAGTLIWFVPASLWMKGE